MKFQACGLAAAIAIAFAVSAQAQTSPGGGATSPTTPRTDTPAATDRAPQARTEARTDRKTKNAEEERIEADYKAERAKCDSLQGNAKDVCQKEAKGKEKIAKAELDAKNNPSERNTRKVSEAKAEAQYEVAKEKCDDMKGKEKSACEKEAKAMRDRAKADIKGNKSASRGASAPAERQTDRPVNRGS
jgi:hypothetical protein